MKNFFLNENQFRMIELSIDFDRCIKLDFFLISMFNSTFCNTFSVVVIFFLLSGNFLRELIFAIID